MNDEKPTFERVDYACGCWGRVWYGSDRVRSMRLCDRHVARVLARSAVHEHARQLADRNRRTGAAMLEWMRSRAYAKRLPALLRSAELAGRRALERESPAPWEIKTADEIIADLTGRWRARVGD